MTAIAARRLVLSPRDTDERRRARGGEALEADDRVVRGGRFGRFARLLAEMRNTGDR